MSIATASALDLPPFVFPVSVSGHDAPSHFFSCHPSQLLSKRGGFQVLFLLLFFLSGRAVCQTNQEKIPVKPFFADVVMILQPRSASSLRIGLSYRKIVPHKRVKEEIGRLASNLQASSTQDLQISESHLDPTMPRTTGALFTLATTSVGLASGNSLIPYIQAFQNWDRIELLYQSPDDLESSPTETFSDPRLTVRLFREGGGLLRYEAEVKSHTGELPTPQFTESKGRSVPSTANSTPAPGSGRQSSNATSSTPPVLLLLMVGGLLGGIGAYLLIVRRDRSHRERHSARSLRQ